MADKDEILDLLDPEGETEEVEPQEPAAAETETPIDSEAQADEPAPEPEPEAEPAPDVEEVAAESSEGEPTEVAAKGTEQTSNKQNSDDGLSLTLRTDIAKLRGRVRAAEAARDAALATQAVPPAQTPQDPTEQAPPDFDGIPLEVRDGQVVLPADALQEAVRASIPQPSAQELRAQRAKDFKSRFTAKAPENAAVLEQVDNAVDFFTEAIKARAYELDPGANPESWDVGGVMRFADEYGVMDQFAQHFPDMRDDIGGIMAAGSTQNEYMIEVELSRFAQKRRGANGGVTSPHANSNVQPITSTAPSLADVGSSSQNEGGDKARYAALMEKQTKDPFFSFTKADEKELDRLERKFG